MNVIMVLFYSRKPTTLITENTDKNDKTARHRSHGGSGETPKFEENMERPVLALKNR